MARETKHFKDAKSLDEVQKVIDEAEKALNDKTMTIEKSSCKNILLGASKAVSVGTAIHFGALAASGASLAGTAVGVSTIGGTIFTIGAAPIAVAAGIGFGISKIAKNQKLKKEKLELYIKVIHKQNDLLRALLDERKADKERIDCLTALVNALTIAADDLTEDLGEAE